MYGAGAIRDVRPGDVLCEWPACRRHPKKGAQVDKIFPPSSSRTRSPIFFFFFIVSCPTDGASTRDGSPRGPLGHTWRPRASALAPHPVPPEHHEEESRGTSDVLMSRAGLLSFQPV